jgi:organic hydroperoxide reductase OsmC/OhrA
MNDSPIHRFEVSATWSGDGAGRGEVCLRDSESVAIAGDPRLGGSGRAANPEQLLLGATAACFLNTWAIFLKKLSIPFSEPALTAACEVGPDPGGGFRVTGVTLRVRVPAAVVASHRAPLEKTLSLAEKYCIVSKVIRAGVPMKIEIEEI